MRNEKRILLLSYYSLFAVVLFGAIVLLAKFINDTWENGNTWDTQPALSLPVSEPLHTVLSKETTQSKPGQVSFIFKTDYCYLYEIVKTEGPQSALTINCSLISKYLFDSLTESQRKLVKPDISLVIHENDPRPISFLAQADTTYSALGKLSNYTQPVTLTVTGTITKPQKDFKNLVNHFVSFVTGKNTLAEGTLVSYEVKSLTNASDSQKSEFADKWIRRVNESFEKGFLTNLSKKKDVTSRLNYFRESFSPTSMSCTKLTTCVAEYAENPAEKIIYFMYGLHRSNKQVFTENAKDLYSSIYPFNKKYPSVNASAVRSKESSDWTIFSVYNFPVCPVAEVVNNESNDATKLFVEYAKSLDDFANTEAQHLAFLKTFNQKFWTETEGWDADFIVQLDAVCGNVLANQATTSPALKKALIDVYFEMLSTQAGEKVTYNKNVLANYIYTHAVFSPYNTPLLIDTVLMHDRTKGIETVDQQIDSHIEWKSLLTTLIISYLYETL